MGDRKAYQKAYYQANKKRLNARKAAARRTKKAANGSAKLNAPKLTGAKAAKAISDWSARNLVVPTPPPPPPDKGNPSAWLTGNRLGCRTHSLRASRRPRFR